MSQGAPDRDAPASDNGLVVGVDAGGTNTRAVVLDTHGTCLGYGRCGPGNPISAGVPMAVANIMGAIELAMVAATGSGLAGGSVGAEGAGRLVGLGLSIAGIFSNGGRLPELEQALRAKGVTAPLRFDGDVMGAYFSATTAAEGLVMIVGTGATASRVHHHQMDKLADGLGWLLGDAGSGFWVGHRIAMAAAAELDGTGPATSLTPAVLEAIGCPAPGRLDGPRGRDPRLTFLLDWAYSRRPVQLSELGSLVADPRHQDDPLAREILDAGARALLATIESLGPVEGEPIVLGGSVVGQDAPLGRRLRGVLGDRIRYSADGVAGAAIMGMQVAGLAPGDQQLAYIVRTLPAARDKMHS